MLSTKPTIGSDFAPCSDGWESNFTCMVERGSWGIVHTKTATFGIPGNTFAVEYITRFYAACSSCFLFCVLHFFFSYFAYHFGYLYSPYRCVCSAHPSFSVYSCGAGCLWRFDLLSMFLLLLIFFLRADHPQQCCQSLSTLRSSSSFRSTVINNRLIYFYSYQHTSIHAR